MDFHSLTRRELQALCKKNKIPANITNVAMADALKALKIVEGIEEFMQPSQSETAQSSMESPTRSEVTSPYVPPPSGVRSTRRRQFGKEDPEEVKSVTRTRHTARRNLVNDVPKSKDYEVGAPMTTLQSSKNGEDENKHVLMTPVSLGVTSRRRKVKEDNTVQRVYSTRRSVRLAEKNVKMLNEDNNEVSSEVPMKEPTKIGFSNVEKDLKEEFGDSDETSEISGGDSIASSLENLEEYNLELVSAQNQGVLIGKEIKLGSSPNKEEKGSHYEASDHEEKMTCSDAANVELNLNNEHHFETSDPEQGKNESSDKEAGSGLHLNHEVEESDLEQMEESNDKEAGSGLHLNHEVEESNLEQTEESNDNQGGIGLNLNNEVQESDPEQEMEESSDNQAGIGSNLNNEVQESDPEQVMEESSDNQAGIGFDEEAELKNKNDETEVMSLNLNDEAGIKLDTETESDEEESDNGETPEEHHFETSDPEQEMKESSDQEAGSGVNLNIEVEESDSSDESIIEIAIEAEMGEKGSDKADDISGETMATGMNFKYDIQKVIGDMNGPKSTCYTECVGNTAAYIQNNVVEVEDSSADVEFSVNGEANNGIKKEKYEGRDLDVALAELTELKIEQATKEVSPGAAKVIDASDNVTGFQNKCSAIKAVFTDNKENIGSAVKKRAKDAAATKKDLEGFSMRQLRKMLAEKLEITEKRSKDGQEGSHHGQAPMRALQPLHKD